MKISEATSKKNIDEGILTSPALQTVAKFFGQDDLAAKMSDKNVQAEYRNKFYRDLAAAIKSGLVSTVSK